ncbi:hypothetical protein NDU88_003860 [Pleurodeles waltl]|uniref:Uncharacterized protein n=1 Tax=Pleurodeles waltl TaxID=8319 RepID=A0AAV7NMS2_PLEWA|nr:hypothetical protein NDU88_003860 [Pleurodeles waltl]
MRLHEVRGRELTWFRSASSDGGDSAASEGSSFGHFPFFFFLPSWMLFSLLVRSRPQCGETEAADRVLESGARRTETNTEVLHLVCAAGDAAGFALQPSWGMYWNSSWHLEETAGASLDDINLPLATTVIK